MILRTPFVHFWSNFLGLVSNAPCIQVASEWIELIKSHEMDLIRDLDLRREWEKEAAEDTLQKKGGEFDKTLSIELAKILKLIFAIVKQHLFIKITFWEDLLPGYMSVLSIYNKKYIQYFLFPQTCVRQRPKLSHTVINTNKINKSIKEILSN